MIGYLDGSKIKVAWTLFLPVSPSRSNQFFVKKENFLREALIDRWIVRQSTRVARLVRDGEGRELREVLILVQLVH